MLLPSVQIVEAQDKLLLGPMSSLIRRLHECQQTPFSELIVCNTYRVFAGSTQPKYAQILAVHVATTVPMKAGLV